MHRQLSPTTVKNITSFTYLPVSIDSDQFIQNNAIGTCAIGSSRASNAGILDCVVVKQCALAEAGRGLGRTLDCPRRAFVAACVAICFGGFPLFVEVGIDVAFFARGFSFAVLVLAGWAGGACTCCAAVLSDIATVATGGSFFACFAFDALNARRQFCRIRFTMVSFQTWFAITNTNGIAVFSSFACLTFRLPGVALTETFGTGQTYGGISVVALGVFAWTVLTDSTTVALLTLDVTECTCFTRLAFCTTFV